MDVVAVRDNMMCVVLFLVRALAVQAIGCAAGVSAPAGRAGTRVAIFDAFGRRVGSLRGGL